MSYHNPVLLNEAVDGLSIVPNGVYVDVTYGGGGHSAEILKRLGTSGKLYAFDQDNEALANKIKDERLVLINENFRYMNRFLRFYGLKAVHGILADFGVSSYQFDKEARGFSTRFNAQLDMRMNQQSPLSAYEVINTYQASQLKNLFYSYGELRQASAIANLIVSARETEPIVTTFQLKEVLKPFLGHQKENKVLAQIYQAIRIEVNNELEVLKEFLMQVPQVLIKGGRLSCISYHSLEDRLVKRFIRSGLFEGEPERDVFGNFNVPLKKVGGLIVPSSEEIETNSRARSAKLRIAEKN